MFAAIGITAIALYALPVQAARRIIVIENMQFTPASATVERGDEVVWINRDLVAHTATSAGAFDSHAIAPGQSWTYVARVPGRYAYGCSLHPTMKATLIVEKSRGRSTSR
ncbi:MAG: cupredoxin family copper-binding protein [Burkholderiales bacterium]|nr:cupredoxin family copper-binding protein [Burkholderiales bacterium]